VLPDKVRATLILTAWLEFPSWPTFWRRTLTVIRLGTRKSLFAILRQQVAAVC